MCVVPMLNLRPDDRISRGGFSLHASRKRSILQRRTTQSSTSRAAAFVTRSPARGSHRHLATTVSDHICMGTQGCVCTHRTDGHIQRRSRPQDRHLRSKTLPGAPGGSILGARTKGLGSRGPRNLRSKGNLSPQKETSYVGRLCRYRDK